MRPAHAFYSGAISAAGNAGAAGEQVLINFMVIVKEVISAPAVSTIYLQPPFPLCIKQGIFRIISSSFFYFLSQEREYQLRSLGV